MLREMSRAHRRDSPAAATQSNVARVIRRCVIDRKNVNTRRP